MKGVTIILMKGYNSKSRVSLNQRDHVRLIDALSFDLYNVILATSTCNDSWDCLIASPDRLFSERCKKKNISVLDLIPGELNSIFRQIQNWAVEEGYDALILCAGDIPLLQGDLIDKIKELLYLWTLYPFKVSPTRLHDIKKLDSTSKKIIRYIMEKKQSTLSMVIDELDKIPIERSLVLIFDLMNNNYLEPLFDAYVVPIEKQYKD